jgi:hypothetical protein
VIATTRATGLLGIAKVAEVLIGNARPAGNQGWLMLLSPFLLKPGFENAGSLSGSISPSVPAAARGAGARSLVLAIGAVLGGCWRPRRKSVLKGLPAMALGLPLMALLTLFATPGAAQPPPAGAEIAVAVGGEPAGLPVGFT